MCELGQRLICAYSEIDDVIGQIDWYRYPCEIQKIMPTIIVNSQKPIAITIFGNMTTNRETCHKVGYAHEANNIREIFNLLIKLIFY